MQHGGLLMLKGLSKISFLANAAMALAPSAQALSVQLRVHSVSEFWRSKLG